ncbi:hypothetical protein E5720_06005 [Rhodococcus sp. PAMC28707]|uniref:hypothetical protein n=1 Tax=unclassified Rhodococcus (in: high G+C Gram-positive bacteria) TaxID=192944 RepID=UPI00109DEEF7|nr:MULTISPECIES: hypothetical protein [unclassified Rhodococcus (in: high G+C Gram-positive bacteria)]QCB50181.1 hypothetical protein E5769_08010 [Rhodococcus sp. PAMC28705]QCB58126.1 hypothetical protein E5720_06005 [Rhodococcus sp. PAMC28707]
MSVDSSHELPEGQVMKLVRQYRNRRTHARSLRALYARAHAVSSPSMRDELLVIAQRSDFAR